MAIKRAVGRPPKVNYQIIIKLADAVQHNSTISEACLYAGISRDTYYRHLHEPVFAEKMTAAKANQSRLVFSFLTVEAFN